MMADERSLWVAGAHASRCLGWGWVLLALYLCGACAGLLLMVGAHELRFSVWWVGGIVLAVTWSGHIARGVVWVVRENRWSRSLEWLLVAPVLVFMALAVQGGMSRFRLYGETATLIAVVLALVLWCVLVLPALLRRGGRVAPPGPMGGFTGLVLLLSPNLALLLLAPVWLLATVSWARPICGLFAGVAGKGLCVRLGVSPTLVAFVLFWVGGLALVAATRIAAARVCLPSWAGWGAVGLISSAAAWGSAGLAAKEVDWSRASLQTRSAVVGCFALAVVSWLGVVVAAGRAARAARRVAPEGTRPRGP